MKRLIIFILTLPALWGCENEKRVFDDYDYQTIYFPIQYPVRTLSLGNDLIDNSIDRQHKFTVSALVGGFYQSNNRDWRVDFEVDASLVPENTLRNKNGEFLIAMPEQYYSLDPGGQVVIPKGSFEGKITVSLEDAFFADPVAITGRYVIPLRITGSPDTERILRGEPNDRAPATPDPHQPTHWDVAPMDYTLFAVKYVNPYHGDWLRRGKTFVRDASGAVVRTIVYHAGHVEYNTVATLKTISMNEATTSVTIDGATLSLSMRADEGGDIEMGCQSSPDYEFLYGSGKYEQGGESWGGTPEKPTLRDAIYLDYYFEKAGYTFEAVDTLVFRDRNIFMETERPTIVNP
jgi:hypothetical protein